MLKEFLTIFLFVNVISASSFSQNEEESDFLYMKKVTMAIGTVVKDSIQNGNNKTYFDKFVSIGSGLMTYIKVGNTAYNVVVSARHVIKFFSDNNLPKIFIRPAWADTMKTTEYFGLAIPIRNPDNSVSTFLYPDSAVDLGCIAISPFYYDSIFEKGARQHGNNSFPFDEMTKPHLGSQVWICGYPAHVENTLQGKYFYSISTFKPGYVTWIPSANMNNKELNHITLVESNITFGNSGGPVFSITNKYIELVGIMVAMFEENNNVYIDGNVILQPGTNKPFITKTRSGVSIIENAEYVQKLIKYLESEINRSKK